MPAPRPIGRKVRIRQTEHSQDSHSSRHLSPKRRRYESIEVPDQAQLEDTFAGISDNFKGFGSDFVRSCV